MGDKNITWVIQDTTIPKFRPSAYITTHTIIPKVRDLEVIQNTPIPKFRRSAYSYHNTKISGKFNIKHFEKKKKKN